MSCKSWAIFSSGSHTQFYAADPQETLTCSTCGAADISWEEMLLHQRVHERDLECYYCLQGFKYRISWEKHRAKHRTETKPFWCR